MPDRVGYLTIPIERVDVETTPRDLRYRFKLAGGLGNLRVTHEDWLALSGPLAAALWKLPSPTPEYVVTPVELLARLSTVAGAQLVVHLPVRPEEPAGLWPVFGLATRDSRDTSVADVMAYVAHPPKAP